MISHEEYTRATIDALARALAATAAQRDRIGGHAASERELIRRSGLLTLSIPRLYGGGGAAWPEVFRGVRRLAEVDSALAHVYAFHHLQVATIQLYGDAAQNDRLLARTVQASWFWGNALNPLDTRLIATPAEGGWRLTGTKSYASGAVGADVLTLSACPAPAAADNSLLIAVVPVPSQGLTIQQDWNSFGQRQTDSGTVRFDQVFIPHQDVLAQPGQPLPPRSTLRPLLAQLVLTNLYLGIAQGAIEVARHGAEDKKPWFASGVPRLADDPYVQHHFAEFRLQARAAELAADAAVQTVQEALDAGSNLSAQQRGQAAIAVAEAKVLAHRAVLHVSAQLFEITGARSTAAEQGLDRYWRNARVHTLHDPVDYKLRDIGRYVLEHRLPEPTPYS